MPFFYSAPDFTSPEPTAQDGLQRSFSVRHHPSTFSNFSSEAAGPIFIKFHVESALVGVGEGSGRLLKWSRSFDQYGKPAHIWKSF